MRIQNSINNHYGHSQTDSNVSFRGAPAHRRDLSVSLDRLVASVRALDASYCAYMQYAHHAQTLHE